jgi:hypothetical protein
MQDHPANAGISGVSSNFILALHKNKQEISTAQNKRGCYNVSLNKIQLMLCTNQLNFV